MQNKPVCLGCGQAHSEIFMQGPDRLQRQADVFTLRRCLTCGTVFLSPPPTPEQLASAYPDDYAAYSPGRQRSIFGRWAAGLGAAKQVRAVEKAARRKGAAVDMGCGTGDFLAGLKKRGWQVVGTEISPRVAVETRSRQGLEMAVCDAHSPAFAAQSFDMISFWDVLEHLPCPQQALREAARLARPSALLVLSLPNIDSLEASWFGPHWAGWDIPRHLWLFPQAVLKQMLDETGWQVAQVRTFRGRHWLLGQSLRFWLDSLPLPAWIVRPLLVLFRSWPARLLLVPYFTLVERLQRGSILVVFAYRKEGRLA